MSSLEPLRQVVRKLAETFNDPQKRELSYFDFYDDSLTIHGFPQIFQRIRKVLNNSFTPYGERFLISELYLKILLLKEIRLQADIT